MNALADLPLWASLPAALLLIGGGILTLLGSLGLLRLDDFFARVHAPTMGSTLGTYCVLTASMLVSSALAARPVPGVTAEGLARQFQVVVQGGIILAKAANDAEPAREAFDHLERYLRLMFDRPAA